MHQYFFLTLSHPLHTSPTPSPTFIFNPLNPSLNSLKNFQYFLDLSSLNLFQILHICPTRYSIWSLFINSLDSFSFDELGFREVFLGFLGMFLFLNRQFQDFRLSNRILQYLSYSCFSLFFALEAGWGCREEDILLGLMREKSLVQKDFQRCLNVPATLDESKVGTSIDLAIFSLDTLSLSYLDSILFKESYRECRVGLRLSWSFSCIRNQ